MIVRTKLYHRYSSDQIVPVGNQTEHILELWNVGPTRCEC